MALKRLREIGRRAAKMDGPELRVRARQEIGKRQDAALLRLGFDFARSVKKSPSPVAGNFFFAEDGVDSILAVLRQRLPAQVDRIRAQADKILEHRFDLLGYQDLDYGSPIDWHLDVVHGKRARRKPFHRVRYLDFRDVGDSKITWELNRHQHFVTLAKAFRLTGDHRYADEVLRQWRHWQAENPYPVGINWASSLEVAFRSFSWLWTNQLLKGAEGLPDFREEWLRSLWLHGRHIERYLSTYFSPNTHLLGEGVGLFFLGVLCPELAAAERWKELGWEIVLREADRQVRTDGFHFEQSTYYHVYALDFFLHAAVLASVNGIPLPAEFETTLEKMLTALWLLARAGGPPRFGDDDGGRLFDPRRNRSEHLLDPLATGAILFHRGDFKKAAGDLREETIWLLGAEGVRQWDALEAHPPTMDSAALADAGFYLLTAQKPATQLIVDTGPLGTQSGGHGHADALSVCLQSQGRALLIDPGTCEYVGDSGDRDRFRGTAMHNTLRVDGVNQAEPMGPFAWKRLTQSKAEQWIQGQNFDFLVASHDGYQSLQPPVVHRRSVLSLRNGIYLVRDVADGEGKHQMELSWHLSGDLQLVEENVFRVKGASLGLALLPAKGHGWAQEVRREAWSPAYGQKMTATALKFGMVGALPAEFATLLVTLEEAHRSPGTFERIGGQESDSAVREYRYVAAGGDTAFFFGVRGKAWRQHSVSSDAELVCWSRKQAATDCTLILCNGTYVEIEGGPLLRCKTKIAWCELVVRDGQRSVFSSSLESLVEEALHMDEQPGVTVPKS